jgi:CRP/FNR family transcriptional regulator, cyclic AMP receptor protein
VHNNSPSDKILDMTKDDATTLMGLLDQSPNYNPKRVVHLSEDGEPISQGPDILKMLTDLELATLIEKGKKTSYKSGEYFFQQGDQHDGIHFIISGRVRSYYSSVGGREVTLAYWPSGHFVGAPQILGGGEHMWTSVAVEPTIGLWLPGATLRQLIIETPNLAIAVIEGLVYKSMCYTALLQIMGTQSKTSRLGHLLLTLASPTDGDSNKALVSSKHSQEELANLVGSTRQSVSLYLDKFEKQGLIARNGDEIRILNVAQLRAACD